MRPLHREYAVARGTRVWLIGARRSLLLQRSGVHERLRRLGWLVLWLVAKHSLGLWLAAPDPTSMKMFSANRSAGRTDR